MIREETIDFHIKTAWHGIYRRYNQVASQYGSTTTMGYVLLNIDIEQGTPVMKIGPSIGMESRSLTRILKTLEERGMIYKQKDLEDKRSVRVFLTNEGKEKREIAKNTVIALNDQMRKAIPPTKLKTFFEVIKQINQLIENNKIEIKI
ncbi:MAG: MarR family transcriptional regulator [Bacteroidetes bacterium]|nr:MAG: MarR family transcriptional regulator [Bacteroidota bacterium]